MTIVARTTTRVPDHTPERYNRRVEAETAQRVQRYARHPRGIDARLNELDEEWDIERTLEANAAALALSGTLLGAFVDRRFLALPALVSFFLLQHAIQGWCPPVPFFRRRGVRTAREIDIERYALKALRGDFGPIGPSVRDRDNQASHALQAARL
jgi:hypothetical protein